MWGIADFQLMLIEQVKKLMNPKFNETGGFALLRKKEKKELQGYKYSNCFCSEKYEIHHPRSRRADNKQAFHTHGEAPI